VEDAQASLFYLSQETRRLIFNTDSLKYKGLLQSAHFTCQQRLVHEWISWQYAMDRPTLELKTSWSTNEKVIIKTLTILALIQKIWTACCLTAFQSSYDAWFADFQTIVDLGNEVLQEGVDIFQCDAGIIMPLNLTAYKCRHPIIRRQALKLLGSISWREGSHTSDMAYRWCHRIMELEEQDLVCYPGQTNFDETLPTEAARVHMTSGVNEHRADYGVRFLMMPTPWNPQLVD
jgi:hypothetical protein